MQPLALINANVLQDREFQSDLAVIVNGTIIQDIVARQQLSDSDFDITDLAGNYLLPGFIDTQVNGGGGVLFNDCPTLEGIRTIAEAHRQFGTTGLLPTLISDDLDVIESALDAVNAAIDQAVPGVLGIHIEGPFLNQARRGIHEASKLRKLTNEILDQLEPVRNGCSLLTIAPEMMEAGMLQQLVEKGFIVNAGHSNGSYADVSAAVDEGLRGFTHLFNAMSQLGVREAGVVGAALDFDETWCGVIADGHHVAPASLRIAYRCKGPDKLLLVTDAMPPVGSPENEFTLLGKLIMVKDGVCVDAHGTLAGAALDMASAVRNIMSITSCSLAEASVMASTSPATFLGLQNRLGTIKAGMSADFSILDQRLMPVQTFIAGRRT